MALREIGEKLKGSIVVFLSEKTPLGNHPQFLLLSLLAFLATTNDSLTPGSLTRKKKIFRIRNKMPVSELYRNTLCKMSNIFFVFVLVPISEFIPLIITSLQLLCGMAVVLARMRFLPCIAARDRDTFTFALAGLLLQH